MQNVIKSLIVVLQGWEHFQSHLKNIFGVFCDYLLKSARISCVSASPPKLQSAAELFGSLSGSPFLNVQRQMTT